MPLSHPQKKKNLFVHTAGTEERTLQLHSPEGLGKGLLLWRQGPRGDEWAATLLLLAAGMRCVKRGVYFASMLVLLN